MSYHAFISYSHGADDGLAPALQKALSSFARPWYRLRTMRIFRDKSNLSASPALWTSIESALRSSGYLLLLASPRAASSTWVGREVAWWLENKGSQSILIVLTDGSLSWDESSNDYDWKSTNALPSALARAFKEEPLHIDLSWAKSTVELSPRHGRFRSAVVDIAATLLSRPRDELDGDDVRQYRKNRRTAQGAIAILLLLLTSSLVATYMAIDRQRLASERLARLCKALDEAQSAADSGNQGSVYHFQSELFAMKEQCKDVSYTPWHSN